MKRELLHFPLRFATPRAYDPCLYETGISWVERSAEEFSLVEPTHAPHDTEVAAGAVADTVADERRQQRESPERICVNPLRDEPHPFLVGTVKKFGLVGLIACALGAGLLRCWQSLTHRHPH
jgi:hypothetical protein